MKLSIPFSKETIPFYVLAIIVIKVVNLAYNAFFTDVATTANEMLSSSIHLVDNLVWMPILFFFLYFYLYRQGKISNESLRNAVICALIAIIPKAVVMVMLVIKYKSENLMLTVTYLLEFIAWLTVFVYLIFYWMSDFKVKEHHHHHHHHSSDEGVVIERKNSKLGTYEHHHHHHHHKSQTSSSES